MPPSFYMGTTVKNCLKKYPSNNLFLSRISRCLPRIVKAIITPEDIIMTAQKHDINKWKNEQIEYFKRYLSTFSSDSREYNIILQGIRDLEQGL